MSSIAPTDNGSYDADILKELERPIVCCYSSEHIGNEALQWRKIYQNYVRNLDNSLMIYTKMNDNYEVVSEIQKVDITSNILNMFEMLRDKGDYYIYLSNRLHNILEDEPELSLNDKSFVGLYNFSQLDSFKLYNFSLQISEEGRANLQKTYKNGFVFIEFLEDNNIFYNIMVKNKDITNLGTYNDFFKDFSENLILA